MTPDELKNFRAMVGLQQDELAAVFGVSRRTLQDMENGTADIRHSIDLACMSYARGTKKYDEERAELTLKRRNKLKRRKCT